MNEDSMKYFLSLLDFLYDAYMPFFMSLNLTPVSYLFSYQPEQLSPLASSIIYKDLDSKDQTK